MNRGASQSSGVRTLCVLIAIAGVVTGVPALLRSLSDIRSALLTSGCGLLVFLLCLFRKKMPAVLFPFLLAAAVFGSTALIWNAGQIKRLANVWQFLFFTDRAPWTGGHTIGAALAFAIITFLWRSWEVPAAPLADRDDIISGPRLVSQSQAQAIVDERRDPVAESLFWAGVRLPRTSATEHFVVVGTPGSGKTLTLQMLMKSVLPGIAPGSNRRALIYDAKRDTSSLLAGIFKNAEHQPPVYFFNPFDRRASPWALNKDIRDGATAHQLAVILIPKPPNISQPFFIEASQGLLGGVMEAFAYLAPESWTFRDVILTMRHTERIVAVLSACPNTRYLIAKYITGAQRDKDVEATIETIMRGLSFVAAAWHHSTRPPLSLREWMDSESILILGSDPTFDSILNALNRAFFKRVVEMVRRVPDVKEAGERETWAFIDELRNAGHLEDLDKFIVEGRSKGACVAIGFQDIQGLREVYGEKRADEIIGACANKVFLQNGDQATIDYATKHFKNQEVIETRVSRSHSDNYGEKSTTSSDGYSVSRNRVMRPVVHDGLLKSLPRPEKGRSGFAGYCDTAGVGTMYPYRMELGTEFLDAELPRRDRSEPDVIDVEGSHFVLPEWEPSDLARLNLSSFPQLLSPHEPARPAATTPTKPAASKSTDDDPEEDDIFSGY